MTPVIGYFGAMETSVIALLQEKEIPFRLLPHKEPVFTVREAAAQRGVALDEMVKSILLREKTGKRRYVMACLLGPMRLVPQAVRTHLPEDWRRLTFASASEIVAITGCVQGAVTPIALPLSLLVVFDTAIGFCRKVNMSSGDPRAGIEMQTADLLAVVQPLVASIAVSSS